MITLYWKAAFAASFLTLTFVAGTALAESPPSPAELLIQSAAEHAAGSATLSPGAKSLRAELARQRDPASAEQGFYQARGYLALWLTEDGAATPAARALIDWAGAADANALPTERYGVSGLAARLDRAASGSRSDAAALELELTQLFLTYGRDVSTGLLKPRSISKDIKIKRLHADPAGLLAGVGAAADAAAFLDALVPADPAYGRLLTLYARMRGLARDGGWGSQVVKGATLRLGDRHARVEQLRARLTAMGDLAASGHFMAASPPTELAAAATDVVNDATPGLSDPRLFDAELETAVRAFQARHGLNTDGIVGPATLATLNTTAAARARQIAVNLERMRWLNRDLGQKYVIVNTAGFEMAVIENGLQIFSSIVIVGQPKHQTPEFSDEMEYMVVNPTWYVPKSLAGREILPSLKRDPGYLKRKNMTLVGADASTIDWSTVTPATFPGRLQQAPGPGNALGKVKFMFPNDYAIYLHDTPARNLFSSEIRAYSNGCVRVEKPFEFARVLLADQEADPAAAFDRWVQSKRETYVKLRKKVPVHITYRTVWFDEDGGRQFRADTYRRDRKVMAALTHAGVAVVDG